jgi:hypothetical protein
VRVLAGAPGHLSQPSILGMGYGTAQSTQWKRQLGSGQRLAVAWAAVVWAAAALGPRAGPAWASATSTSTGARRAGAGTAARASASMAATSASVRTAAHARGGGGGGGGGGPPPRSHNAARDALL